MISSIPIVLACGDYDRTRAIRDGRVAVEGCAVTYLAMEPEEAFHRAFKHREFDVTELSFSSYLRTLDAGNASYIGIPAFVSRLFRHSAVYIRTDRGIREPADLKGKLIGLPEYQITAVVWLRGIMQDEYGVKPTDIRWRQGGIEEPGRQERTPLKPIPGIDLKPVPPDKTLSGMLESGELDALYSARAPSCFLRGAPNVARLFPDFREVEKAYYRKTGIFPPMHLIGIKRELVERYPWLPASLYKAFLAAKNIALHEVKEINALPVTLPWLVAEAQETVELMGEDFWRYGARENALEIETLTRYAYEQGLISRKFGIEDLFPASVIEVSKV
ncbi:MAG TPA: ABC transporter substrate-binding protein [Micropepsaceae bacterium]|jgi:4,5-dihydroxyphthalate decarboxylase|nr:ABC transporter substrate-binding protein [Micropepsaceae bacterium]